MDFFFDQNIQKQKTKRGFGLIETIVGVAVFTMVAVSAYYGFAKVLEGSRIVRIKSAATNLANEQFEIIRNLPYTDVGIVDGLPVGLVPRTQNLNRDGIDFIVTTTIRNIDDPFDGTIGGEPNDTSPADNKLVEVEVDCDCGVDPIVYATRVAPKHLEITGNNGALFVQVLDANGEPVQGADVHIENNVSTNTIIIDDTTNVQGMLQVIDTPPGTGAYEIAVSKSGYSSERTYAIGDLENPVPDKPHANISSGQVTQISFAIDELSDLTVSSRNSNCSPVSNVGFNIKGSKTIGLEKYKYDVDHNTGASGNIYISDIEWDTYEFTLTSSSYDLAGSNTILPLDLSPGSSQHVDLIIAENDPNAFLVKVRDGATDLPLANVEVELYKDETASSTLITGRGFMTQTDWSGGSGQSGYYDESKYYATDGNIDSSSVSGEIKLGQFLGEYFTSGYLESSTFDTGTTTNFHTLDWVPGSQPLEAGENSVRLQVATSDVLDPGFWNYVGPDGTSGSYFTSSGQSFSSVHNGDQYLRYKVYMATTDIEVTPTVSDVSFTFSSDCLPSGQAFFTGLSDGAWDITASKDGYQDFIQDDYVISDDWAELEIILNP